MKLIPVTFMVLTLSVLLIAGCEKQKDPGTGIRGSVVNNSDCKYFKSGDLKFNSADTFSCIYFTYDSTSREIVLQHINAGFNCCPGTLKCKVTTDKDTIIIREYERESACDCNCLFDLVIILEDVERDTYIVKFIEPYVGGRENLIFEMDLNSGIEGEFCVKRKGYPWGE
jgi:hypothetical protein